MFGLLHRTVLLHGPMREISIHRFQEEEIRVIPRLPPGVGQIILNDRIARFPHLAEQYVPQHTVLELDPRGQLSTTLSR